MFVPYMCCSLDVHQFWDVCVLGRWSTCSFIPTSCHWSPWAPLKSQCAEEVGTVKARPPTSIHRNWPAHWSSELLLFLPPHVHRTQRLSVDLTFSPSPPMFPLSSTQCLNTPLKFQGWFSTLNRRELDWNQALGIWAVVKPLVFPSCIIMCLST